MAHRHLIHIGKRKRHRHRHLTVIFDDAVVFAADVTRGFLHGIEQKRRDADCRHPDSYLSGRIKQNGFAPQVNI